jgi:hypothetical protein
MIFFPSVHVYFLELIGFSRSDFESMEKNEPIKEDNTANNSANINNTGNSTISKKTQAKNKRAAKLAFRNQFATQEDYEAAMKAKNPNYRPSKRRKIVQEKQEETKNTNKIQDQLEDFDNDHVEYEFKNGKHYNIVGIFQYRTAMAIWPKIMSLKVYWMRDRIWVEIFFDRSKVI